MLFLWVRLNLIVDLKVRKPQSCFRRNPASDGDNSQQLEWLENKIVCPDFHFASGLLTRPVSIFRPVDCRNRRWCTNGPVACPLQAFCINFTSSLGPTAKISANKQWLCKEWSSANLKNLCSILVSSEHELLPSNTRRIRSQLVIPLSNCYYLLHRLQWIIGYLTWRLNTSKTDQFIDRPSDDILPKYSNSIIRSQLLTLHLFCSKLNLLDPFFNKASSSTSRYSHCFGIA